MALGAERIEAFRIGFGGVVLLPDEDGYDLARSVHNGIIDRRPAIIARCHGTADVVSALALAKESGLEVAVRGGGHNVAGRAVWDGSLVVDLSPMKGIFVDSSKQTVLAQGGVTWAEFNRETQLHGLATTGGVVSSTGIAGLTLGGGLGWLMGRFGMAVDNVLSIEVVLASGEVVRASASEHPDLFWAMRGGGGNFGIATAIEYQLHPVGPMVTGGLVAHPFAAAREVLQHYREVTSDLPDEQTVFAALIHSPDGAEKLAGMIVCHSGPEAEGEAALRPIKEFGSPALDAIGPLPYSALNQMLDGSFPRGALNYWKSSFLSELTDDAIDALIRQYELCPSPMSGLVLEHFHGAVTRIPVADTAYPHRSEGYNLVIAGQWMDPSTSAENIAWAKETYEAMRPFFAPNRYVNYIPDDEVAATAASEEAYGENLARLREAKRRYDPDNVFHLNQNILPA